MIHLAVLVYRALTRLLPGSLRLEYRADMIALFERTLRDERGRGPRACLVAACGGVWGAMLAVAGSWRDELTGGSMRRTGSPNGWEERMMDLRTASRQAVRSLLRAPGVTFGVVSLFGLGIGAAVTVLSVVDGVLLRHLPYPDPDRIVVVQDGAHSWPDFQDWRRTVPAVGAFAAASGQTLTLTGEVPEHLEGARVSDGFFELLGGEAARGRLPSEIEFGTGARVAVLGHDAWVSRWGADPDVVGTTLSIDGHPFEVVGVLAASFRAPAALTGPSVDVWIPVDPADPDLNRHDRSFNVVGRLADGASMDDAAAQLADRAVAFAQEEPDLYADDDGRPRRTFPPVTIAEATTGDSRTPLSILLLGSLLLLLVACGNAAGLLLARGAARRGELATRRALGGGRPAILAQLLIEAVLLALWGWVAGLGIATFGVEVVRALEPGNLPRLGEVAVDLRVAGMALALALVAGALAGLIPAWTGARVAPGAVLQRSASGSRGRHRGGSRRWLVLAEAALASLLLVGSLTVVRGFAALTTVEGGFQTEGVWAVSIDVGRDVPEEERAAEAEAVRARLAALPGVTGAGAGVSVPYQVAGGNRCCWLGSLSDGAEEVDRVWVHPVTPGYFEALGIAFRAGRGFRTGDVAEGTTPVVLNAAAAEELFGGAGEPGRLVKFGSQELRVVGIIEDVRHWGPDQPIEAEFYLPYDPDGTWASGLTYALRGDPPSLDVIRAAIAEAAPRSVVDDLRPMADVQGEALARFRFYALVLGIFAGAALLVACAGLAGTLLYDVRLREYEFGVRSAMGARVSGLVSGVVLRATSTVAAGAVLGLLAFWPLRGRLGDIVPGAEGLDPGALVGFVGLLAVAALAAAWIPARFVARTDPVRALG